MSAPEESKPSKFTGALSFVIAIAALLGFIYLNRKMAPPFPNFPAKNATGSTNSPATNSAAPAR